MENHSTSINLGKVNPKVENDHIPSTTQADTLFNFSKKLEYLIDALKNKMLSPRYNTENVEYLKIENLQSITIPMKCFCDINLHKISEHLEWYGYYGIAFPKAWGIKTGIQPVHYINAESALAKDLSSTFSSAISLRTDDQTTFESEAKNYLLHQLMYSKPYSGLAKKEENDTVLEKEKCFTDESEWRFIPKVTAEGYQQVFINNGLSHPSALISWSNSMSGNSAISLNFEYSDIKYIIVKQASDLDSLIESINGFQIDNLEKQKLIRKIIVWEDSRGDF